MSLSWVSQDSKPHDTLLSAGACLAAMATASIKMVPEPHIGSTNGLLVSANQPERIINAAAKFSFKGAAPLCSR